jgi:SAM-dependent methyltransferase
VDNRLLDAIYRRRWKLTDKSSAEAINRGRAWDSLVEEVFQRLIPPASIVLDLGCGPGDFINRICAKQKIAIDISDKNTTYLGSDVTFHRTSSDNLSIIPDDSVDFVFTSNLLEHLESRSDLFSTFAEVSRILKKDLSSTFIVMMPNSRKVGMKFYDFIDHVLPLNDKSIVEALEVSDFQVTEIRPGFFPYSVLGSRFRVPKFLFFFYLKIPMRNRPLAGQMLCTAIPRQKS